MTKFKARLHDKMKAAGETHELNLPVVLGKLQLEIEALPRFDFYQDSPDGIRAEEHNEGEYVRYEDVADLIGKLKEIE